VNRAVLMLTCFHTRTQPPMVRPGPVEAGDIPIEPFQSELARFFGYSHDILVIMDTGGRVLMISPSVRRVLGEPVEELIGSRLLLRVHPGELPDRHTAK